MNKILTPDDLEYHITLGNIPYYFQSIAQKTIDCAGWVADAATGLVRPCTYSQMIDYIYGGEYEERLANDGYDPDKELEVFGDISGITEFYIDL